MSESKNWDGKERRHNAAAELNERLDAIVEQVEEVAKTVAAMQRCFDMFRTKYEVHLKEQLEATEAWKQLRKDLITAGLKTGIGATVLFLGGLILYGLRARLLEWLN